MKKILLSLLSVGVVAVGAVFITNAYFSDTEKSVGNTFEAGAIDLKVDSKCSYNGEESQQCGNWKLKDLGDDNRDIAEVTDRFFNFTDIKPGDFGENTISLHLDGNDAWACITIDNVKNLENGINEPEAKAGDVTDTEGELAKNLYFTAWLDNGNNIWDTGEPLLFTNKYGPLSDVLENKTYTLADSTTGNPIKGGETTYIGLKWCAGAMQVDEALGIIACDGSTMGNESQTDSVSADVTFYVEQSRNNPDFKCVQPKLTTLVLENKDQEYNRLTNDGIYGELTFNPSGCSFDYGLKAYGLVPSKAYSLLYYADGWAGNHPGYYFGSATADGSGYLTMSGNPDLPFSLPTLPDTNYLTGAKIWLIPSADYNSGTQSVITWPFANDWLFESNLIQFNDTGSCN